MPILLPEEQYYISNFDGSFDSSSSEQLISSFFSHYLNIAESTFNRNAFTRQIHAEFKNALLNSVEIFNSSYNTNFPSKDILEGIVHDNYYSYFKKTIGFYDSYYNIAYYDPILQSDTNIQVGVPFNSSKFPTIFQWSLTKTSYSILSVRNNEIDESIYNYLNDKYKLMLAQIKLEIILMKACGFHLVLTVVIDQNCEPEFFNLIMEIIRSNSFIEIHFTIDDETPLENIKKFNFIDAIKQITNLFSNEDYMFYFYLYSTMDFCDQNKLNEYEKELKNNPFYNHIVYSIQLSKVFSLTISDSSTKTKNKFIICEDGLDCDFIQISLCNVPLYQTDNEEIDITPLEMSGKIKAYIEKDDYLEWNKPRIKAVFEDGTFKYVQFDDIHIMKPELYVSNTLYLSKTKQNSIYAVSRISNNEIESTDNSKLSKSDNETILNYISNKFIENGIKLYENQLLAIYEASNLLNSSSKRKKSSNVLKGTIYQVETGEGKSYIIEGLASLLAIKEKTIHIVTSNIALAFRDYIDSLEFFQKINIKSAVLLHYDELQQIITSKDMNSGDFKFDKSIFDKELFHNSSNMNISVCGISNDNEVINSNKPQIIFSTITNFEGFYLRLLESYPSYIKTFFSSCYLIIDEADTILLDEITNGTILSKAMNSNAERILKFVYKKKLKGMKPNKLLRLIQKKWPKCTDITIQDILDMYNDIDIVNDPEFCHGKKYSVEPAKPEDIKEALGIYNDDEDEGLIQKIQNKIEEVKSKIDDVKTEIVHQIHNKIFKNKKKEIEHEELYAEDDNDEEEEEEEEEEEDLDDFYEKKIIVPFDYNNKGFLEPNKEFSGFIHQFIAIKEKLTNEKNKKTIIKKVSMNYLYASHPIFVSLYPYVCGFTGTIGNQYDRKILKDQYYLDTCIIPRHLPNLRVDLPVIVCHDTIERNNKIVQETLEFHQKGYPTLIVCQELNDIVEISSLLKKVHISAYLIDGKTFENKPQFFSGKNGAVTIGTNLCGRGTNIQVGENPLHVIVTYYSSNVRVMQQAFGRTARQGRKGTSRIICTEKQYFAYISIFNGNEIKNILSEIEYKNILQSNFIRKFSDKRKWIFDADVTHQSIDPYIKQLRKVAINVNRYVAFSYEFPLCMSIDTFLDIQSQKIFSLYNCPNCKYTWMLFQRYIREMILESWSLFIEKSRQNFERQNNVKNYIDYLDIESNKLFEKVSKYIPKPSYNTKTDIVSTFVSIFSKVVDNHQESILKSFSENSNFILKKKSGQFCIFKFGFFPFTLVDKSGAKINQFKNEDQKINYIFDPELKYMQRKPKGSGFDLVSITQKIDGIYDLICQKINEVIGGYIGLKFFLRRTLAGCEFGISFDLHLNNGQNKMNCLIDTDPLFMFTIHLKSKVPLLAGILIIGLVYLASIANSIKDLILSLPEKAAVKAAQITVMTVLEAAAKKAINTTLTKIVDKISDLIKDKLKSQISNLKKINKDLGAFYEKLYEMSLSHDWENSTNKISEFFEGKFKIPTNISEFISDVIPAEQLLNLGFLLILCFAAFLTNFNFKMRVKYDEEEKAKVYNEEQNPEKALEENKKYANSK